ncbi:hypothetical protein BN946_scf185033.g33 [Trametes cinnabarina]|uniref:DUF6533 domain-containing protein n=1 Tax=Pycnoporus cinnabarinus TaxID=5643 RepID=A0A060SRS5_PYCCI|nr:hypothetical protein BN946_scf185033.g33 [Trametes cinnabarina]
MSTSDADELISQLAETYCQVATMALLVYYNLTTLEEEVQYLSRRQLTGSAVLYMLNRYLPLLFAAYGNPFWSFSTNLVCPASPFGKLVADWHIAIASSDKVFSILFESLQYLPWAVSLLARVPLVIADIAMVVITWMTQYKTHRLALSVRGKMNLATVLLRDGTLYFMILTAINITQMVTSAMSVFTQNVGLLPSYLVTFSEPVTAILVSSFLTDLRKAADASTHQHSLASVGTLEFRVVGSLGASLAAPGAGEYTEDDSVEGTAYSSAEGAESTADHPASPYDVELKEVA